MSSHVSEIQLALHAGGDLDDAEVRVFAAHLRGCVECRAALARFEQLETLLKGTFAEPEADELWAVRHRISEKLNRKNQWHGWNWAWAGAAAAIAAIVALAGFESRARQTELPAVAQLSPPPVPEIRFFEAPHLERVAERPGRRHEAGLRSVALITRADGPPLIRMTTTDPNVVILWQSKEEENE